MDVNICMFMIIYGSFSTISGILIDDENYDYNIKNTSSTIDSKTCYFSLKYYNSIGIDNYDVPLGN